MDVLEFENIRSRLVTGVVALASRTFFLQSLSFGATFVLTILLSPSAFGVFFVVSAVVSFLSYFSDIGFAAALIQKKDEPVEADYKTAFTIQQILVGSLVAAGLLATDAISQFYHLEAEGKILFQFLLLAFFLSSLKTIPSIKLERKLDFPRLIIPQLIENIVFYGVAIALALRGLGIVSFAWAALFRGISGLAAIYYVAPWKMGFGISKKSLKTMLSYGVPFQANSLLALVKDDLVTILLGKILPFSHVGYIGWAKKWAEAPLRLIMENIIRVTFPAFARLQSDTKILGKAIEKTFFFLSYFMLPITSMMILFINPLIFAIPKYSKWEPAVFSFYLFAVAAMFSTFSSPAVNALNAIGKIRWTLVLMGFWTVVTWILVPIFVTTLGYEGVAWAAFCIAFTGIVPLFIMKRFVTFRILHAIYKPVIATILMIVPVFLIMHSVPGNVSSILAALAGFIVYAYVSWVWMRKEFLPYLPILRRFT